MKIYNLLEDKSTTVSGPSGKDKVPAVVPEGTFIVPKENAPVAVRLSKGEVAIPPSQVPDIDAKAKQAGLNGIKDLAPNAKPTLPTYQEAKDWNDYLIYFNDKVKKEGITDEELDKGDGMYAQKAFDEYALQKKLPYKYADQTKKMQQYWNDVYNSNDPLALQNVRGRYTKEQLSKVDGRIGSLTRNYYAPTVNHGVKYNTGEVVNGYRGIPDPYNGGISIFDTNNMTEEEAKRQYLENAASKIKQSNQKTVQGYDTGGFVVGYDENDNPIYLPEGDNPEAALQATAQGVNTGAEHQGPPTPAPNVATGKQNAPAEPDYQAMYANTPQIPKNDGSQTILENSKRVQELLGLTTPKFDEQKAERLKKIATINSIGQGLSTAFGGYIGTKGGPILNTATNITPAALAEYNAMVEKDKDNKYRTNIMQVQEAVRGMHDVAANELNNRKANQKALEETSRIISKFKLDRYADNEKYRRDIDLLLFKYGIDVAKTAKDNQYDEEKTKKAVENQWKLARYNQGQANYRAKLKSEGTGQAPAGMVAYYNPQTGQREYIERSKALYIIGKAKQERDSNDDPVYKMEDLITKPDKYNPEEMGLSFYDLLQKYGGGYEPKSDPLGIVDDANRPKDRIADTNNDNSDPDANPNPSHKTNQPSKNNPFTSHGGSVIK